MVRVCCEAIVFRWPRSSLSILSWARLPHLCLSFLASSFCNPAASSVVRKRAKGKQATKQRQDNWDSVSEGRGPSASLSDNQSSTKTMDHREDQADLKVQYKRSGK